MPRHRSRSSDNPVRVSVWNPPGRAFRVTPVTLSPTPCGTYDYFGMTLSALLVCLDTKASEVLQRVLKELSIQVELCPDFARAAVRAAQDRFDVLIVDGESVKAVTALLKETRLSRLNESTLAIVVVPSQDSVRELFALGVNFVLYKPVAHERALSSLRAARSAMRREKRKNARATVHAHAIIDYGNVERQKATLIDLAQDGMSVSFGKKLPPTTKVYFQFQLPGQTASIRLSGQVVWQDWNGRGGVQFVDVPKTSRRLLDEYLSANIKIDAKNQFSEVTIEMEEPLEPAPVGVAMPGHETIAGTNFTVEKVYARPDASVASAAAAPGVAPEPDPNNRRQQNRYNCRIGAEVYRTGIPVPHHCCLTDLSAGGCYLEVALPFPQGSTVELVVRTWELKLHLRGTVLTSHPGYGMGIGFELKTKEERSNVQQLTDFVAATAEPQ